MVTPCKTCASCGNGVPGIPPKDPVVFQLCVVFCSARKEFCEAKKAGKPTQRPSKIAEDKLNSPDGQKRMQRAMAKSGRYGPNPKLTPEKRLMVPWDKPVPASWKRAPMSPERVKRMLGPIREKIISEAKEKAAQIAKKKLVKKAATAWMKFVPVLNVISTAYDIYDLASTGYDLYKMVDEALGKYSGKVFEIRPDVAIEGADGSLQDIYDFKFDGDSFANNPGQKELYSEALNGGEGPKRPKEISQDTCECE